MKVLVLPRDDNPYQELLYTELRRRGTRVRYLGRLTPSHTLNLLLMPLELVAGRITGARLVHLHWVFGFRLPGGPAMRRPAQLWFTILLRLIRLLGLRLVWTAHNVLPHRQIFADDIAARRTLVRACDLVIAHTAATTDHLAVLGARPRRSVVIPHGPYTAPTVHPPGTPGSGAGPRRFLFFGKVEEYKGVEELLTAFAALPYGVEAQLTVAGACQDPELAARLWELAADLRDRVVLRLSHVPEVEMTELFAAADAVVLPFRKITTSGSALLALSYGRPLVLPDLDTLAELPAAAVVRYDGSVPGLTGALTELTEADERRLGMMSTAALEHAQSTGWADIAEATMRQFDTLLDNTPPGRPDARPAVPAAKVRAWFRRIADDALYRGSLLLLANTVCLSGLGFVFWALAARTYSPMAVGLLAAVTAGVNLLATVAALGLPNTVIRHLGRSSNPRELTRVAITAVTVVGGAMALFCFLLVLPLLPGVPDIGRQPAQVALVTALVVFTAAGSTLDAGLIAMRATGALLIKNLTGSTFKILVLLVLTGVGDIGLVLAYGSGTILASILGGIVLWRRLARRGRRHGPIATLRRYLSFSASSYLGTVLGILPSTVVPLEVLAIGGSRETAWFAVAFQLAAFLSFIPSTMAQVLFAEAQTTALRKGLSKAVKGIYSLLVPAVLVTVIAAPFMLRLFGQTYSQNAVGCLRLLAAGALLTAGSYLIDAALIARDRTGAYIFMNGANAVLVLTLVAVMLPYGLTAGAVGWVIAQAISLALGGVVLATSFDVRRSSASPVTMPRP